MPVNFKPIYTPPQWTPGATTSAPGVDTGVSALFTEFAKGVPSFFLRMGEASLGVAEAIVPGDHITPWINNIESFRDRMFPMPEDNWGWVGRTVGEALPFLAASAASYGATGSALAPFLTAFTIEGGSAYNDAKAAGDSEWQAKGEGALVGTINGALESLQIPLILKFAKAGKGSAKALIHAIKNKALKEAGGEFTKISGNILKSAISEGIQEALQEGTSLAVPALISDRFPRNPDGSTNWKTIIDQVAMSGLGGAIAGGFFTGAGSLATALNSSAAPTKEQVKKHRRIIEDSNLKEPEKARLLKIWDEEWSNSDLLAEPTAAEPAGEVETPTEEIEPVEGKVYHGTSQSIEQIKEPIEDTWNGLNIYGQGFYTTDTKSVAEGYTKKGKGTTPAVYEVTVSPDTEKQLYDMEKPLDAQTKKDLMPLLREWELDYILSDSSYKEDIKNLRGLYDTMRAEFSNNYVSADEGTYLFNDIAKMLQGQGYVGYKHKGGLQVKGKPHIVRIFWNPKQDISLIQAPAPVNVYKTTDNSRTGITEDEVVRDGDRYVDKITGKDVVLDTEASGTGIQNAPKLDTKQAFANLIEKLNKHIDEVVAKIEPEKAEISAERGKRFEEYDNIRRQIGDNEISRAFFARAALKGEMKWDITPFKEVFSQDEMNLLFKKVNDTNLTATEHLHVVDGMDKLFFKGKIPSPSDIDALSLVIPRGTIDKLMSMRKRLGEKNYSLVMEALNLPRAYLASYDLSAPLRQGLLMLFRNPKIWFQGLGHQLRAFVSEDYANFMNMQIRTHPLFKTLQKSGLVITRVGGLATGEEVFRSDLAEKVPYLGQGVKASERAYVTFLNHLRAMNFYHVAEQWQGQGHTADDYKQLAAYLNHATGRGDVKQLRKIMPAMSALMFAPRLTIGRVQVFSDLITKPAVRRMIAGDLIKFAGTSLGLLALLSLRKGIDVEWDPRSTDFAKVKIGNTRIDFLGGYQQLIRHAYQIGSGETKATATGHINPTPRMSVLWRFVQSKLSPVAMATIDIARGETFLGKRLAAEPDIIGREIYERFMPLFLQDVIDLGRQEGFNKLSLTTSLLALHGVGAQTYPVSSSMESSRMKDMYAKKYAGRGWDSLGPDIQEMIREYHPAIGLMEAKARFERESTSFLQGQIREQDATSRRIHNSLPQSVQDEMDRLFVRVPGLARRVGQDWYLNKDRYKEYEKITTKLLNRFLPKITQTSSWNRLSDESRSAILNDLIKEIKSMARNQIMTKATINDLEQPLNL